MSSRSRWSIGRIIRDLLIIGPAILRFTRNLRSVVAYDARLAAKSAILLSVSFILLGIFLFSSWLSVLALLFYLLATSYSLWIAFSLIILLNIVLLIWVVIKIVQIKENLLFPNTRDQLGLD